MKSHTLPLYQNVVIISEPQNLFYLLGKLPEVSFVVRLEYADISPPILLEVQLHCHFNSVEISTIN